LPPENFLANIIPENATKLELTWDKPNQRAFGQLLNEMNLITYYTVPVDPRIRRRDYLLGSFQVHRLIMMNENLEALC